MEELRSQEVMRWSSEDRWSSEEQRVERDIKDALLDDDIESESRLAGADTRIRGMRGQSFNFLVVTILIAFIITNCINTFTSIK